MCRTEQAKAEIGYDGIPRLVNRGHDADSREEIYNPTVVVEEQ
jgi:hypothetical protein